MKHFYNKFFVKLKQSVAPGPDKDEIFTPDVFFMGALQNISGEKVVRNEQGEKIINKRIFTSVFELEESDRIEGIDLHEILAEEIGTFYKRLPASNWTEVTAIDVGKLCVGYNATDDTGTGAEYEANGKEYIIENIDDVMYLNRSMEIECVERAVTV